MINITRRSRAAVSCLIAAAAIFSADPASAQISLTPRIFRIDRITCAELLALPTERSDRVLLYFDGFIGGMQQKTTWDERIEGELVDRAVGYCQADPKETVLSAFTRASSRSGEPR